MTVRELIMELNNIEPDRIVIIQKDAEGNGYSPMHDFWTGRYDAETTWSGRAGLETLTDEDKAAGFGVEDLAAGPQCVVFTPIN